MRHRNNVRLREDQRGAVAFEMPFVWLFLWVVFLVPLADLALFCFQFISAYEAVRNVGQYAQYTVPSDVTTANASGGWASSLPSTGYSITAQVYCGDANDLCDSSHTSNPKYYLFSTSFTAAPMVLRSVLCTSNPCTYTLTYTERFE